MAQKKFSKTKKWCNTKREANTLLKQRQAEQPYTGHQLRIYKVAGKYLVGDHWTWLLAVS
jgi:hypothetical protein